MTDRKELDKRPTKNTQAEETAARPTETRVSRRPIDGIVPVAPST